MFSLEIIPESGWVILPIHNLENMILFIATFFVSVKLTVTICLMCALIVASILLAWDRWDIMGMGRKSKGGNIPGPPGLPILGNFHHLLGEETEILNLAVDLVQKYGKIVEINVLGQLIYLVNDPEMLKKLLSSNDARYLNKPKITQSIFSSYFMNGLLQSEHPIWTGHRKVLAKSFKYQALLHQTEVMNLHAIQLVEGIARVKAAEEEPNIAQMLDDMLIGTFLHVLLGSDDVLDQGEQDKFQRCFQTGYKIVQRMLMEPWLILKPIFLLHPACRKFCKLEGDMETFVREVLNKYKIGRGRGEGENSDHGPMCIMQEMLTSGRMSDQQVVDQIFTLIIAGHETVGAAVRFLLLRLAFEKGHQARCREEVDHLFSGKGEQYLTLDDLSELKHLDLCLKENLRLLPVGPAFTRRVDADLELAGGIVIRAGSNVCIAPWTLHRMPELYPEPEKFDPERFSPEGGRGRHSYAYLPFSAGPRNCLGWKYAMTIVKLVVARILREYEVETGDKDKWEEIKWVFGISLATKEELNIKLRKRT